MGLYRFLAMLLAIGLVALEQSTTLGLAAGISGFIAGSGIREILLQGMLALFLFAAALQVCRDGGAWLQLRLVLLSLLIVVMSMLATALVGGWVIGKIGIELSMVHYLLLGLLLAPTDPLAIARLMGFAGATPLQAGRAAGEAAWSSLFALLLFLWLSGVAGGAGTGTALVTGLQLGVASLLLGLLGGTALVFALRRVAGAGAVPGVALAMIVAIWMLATATGLSAPIAALVAGMAVALCPPRWSPDAAVYAHLFPRWSSGAEALVVILLLWLAVELATLSLSLMLLTVAVFLVPVVVLMRVASVYAMMWLLGLREQFTPESIRVMVWGGLRSALAAALVLLLEPGASTTLLMMATFLVLVFSNLIQGPLYNVTAAIARPIAKEAENPPDSDTDSGN